MADMVAYIGLDWGDERHSVHLQTAEGTLEHVELEQKPDVLHAWVAQLKARFPGGQVAIALEQRKGAVVNALMLYDFLVLIPSTRRRWRGIAKPFGPAGPKTIRWTPSCSWIWWSGTATNCGPGGPTRWRRARCSYSASSAANW